MKLDAAARMFVTVVVAAVVGISVILGLEQAEAGVGSWLILVGVVLFLIPALLAVLLSAPDFDIGRGTLYGALAAASPLAIGMAFAFVQDRFGDPVEVFASILFAVTAGLLGGAAGAMAGVVVGAVRDVKNAHPGVHQG